jgi:threonine dehydrogenase-like Zn-dependent dehydrogenase
MRGVVFTGNRSIDIREFPTPEPGPGEALVKMRASGLCGSDLGAYRGERVTGFIGGHEPCGEVRALGPGVTGPAVGTPVIVHHYSGCGVCKHCRAGWEQLCRVSHLVYGFSAHGGHADYILMPARTLIPMPVELKFEHGAAIACGTGTAYAAVKKLEVSGRDTLAIFGQGPVGVSATILAKAMGARVIAVDVQDERLAFAKKLGADETIDASKVDPVGAIHDLTHGEGADSALDCTGRDEPRQWTCRSVRVWGKACYVGEGGTVTLNPSPDIIHRHLTLIGSWTFSTILMAECAQFIVDRKVDMNRLVTDTFPLDRVADAYRAFEGGAPGKHVLVMPA